MKKLKEGNYWKACFDQKHNKYLGRIVYTNREGQTRELYETLEKSSIDWGRSPMTTTTNV